MLYKGFVRQTVVLRTPKYKPGKLNLRVNCRQCRKKITVTLNLPQQSHNIGHCRGEDCNGAAVAAITSVPRGGRTLNITVFIGFVRK